VPDRVEIVIAVDLKVVSAGVLGGVATSVPGIDLHESDGGNRRSCGESICSEPETAGPSQALMSW
jgi:hypothetical protein